MKNITKDLLKVTGATALTLTLAVSAFTGVNNLAFAAATQPEQLTLATPAAVTAPDNAPQAEEIQAAYIEPNLTIIMNKNLDENGIPYSNNIPSANAISYEEAAKIGAQYIWDLYGESIDGKTVEMTYSAQPFSSRAYWHGTVANSKDDLSIPENYETYPAEEGDTIAATNIVDKTLYNFAIDAVTGERVSIYPNVNIPEPEYLSEGKTYTLSPVQMEAMQYEAPANVDEYAKIAEEFAQIHFNHSKVTSVEFTFISLSHGDRAASIEAYKAYQEAYRAGKDKPFTFTLYEEGRGITFNVTDDTGRVANICINMDTKQVLYLNTMDSDFIPGYNADVPGGVG